MRILSKTKLLAFRQCPKRLWLEIHRLSLREDSAATRANFAVGHHVGDIARKLYDPKGKGQLIDVEVEGFPAAFARSKELLGSSQPIFEAGFTAGGALAFSDVMLPAQKQGKKVWRMIEIKSSTSVKDYHRDDAAIQAFVARSAGVPLASLSLAHIDSDWVYPGGEDYRGLLVENDLTDECFGRQNEVKQWIAEGQSIAAKRSEPKIGTGPHCTKPYECGFIEYCKSKEKQAQFPISWIPDIRTKALKAAIDDDHLTDLRDIPDELLNNSQLRVKAHTLSGDVYFDAANAAADLAPHKLPAYFLDFETIQFAVPIWKGFRPYQIIPFQFSVHQLSLACKIEHQSYIDLTGNDPSSALAESLIAACGERGPVFVYNASFETARIRELAERFPRMKRSLLAINDRVVDLFRVAKQRYYHPSQQGSWSIKEVLPSIARDLSYEALDGVQDGGMVADVYLEAISASTTAARKAEIEQQLHKYCALDTYGMIRLWKLFAGRNDLVV